MAQTLNQLWDCFSQLRQDIEALLGPTNNDLPRTLAEARARQAPGQADYVALQERLLNLRAYLREFQQQVNDMEPSKTELLSTLTQLQHQIDNAPSRKDYDTAKDNIKQWETFWAETEPELRQLRTQKSEMDSFAAKAADYDRLKSMEATMKVEHDELVGLKKKEQEMEKQTKEFAAKQADYDRLKAIEQQLIANDGEYKDLLRESNQVKSDANELIELRTRSGQMQDDEDELQDLRQQREEWRNSQQVSGPSVFTTPEAATEPVDHTTLH